MKRFLSLMMIALACLALLPSVHAEDKVLEMSTTTSTQSSGLLEVLLPELQKDTGITVKVIAKGTGAAIRDGMDGNVDVIFVHDTAREEAFVAEGYGTKRYAVMHNDFIILGAKEDPAGISGMKDAAAALKKIADAKAVFVSRGDDSGTHGKEQALWKSTGLALKENVRTLVKGGKEVQVKAVEPEDSGAWYMSVGQGMGKSLTIAEEKAGYILCDRGTYLNYKFQREQGLALEILCEGDPLLFNPYGVIPVNPAKYPHVKFELADTFAKWLVSPRGQGVINGYKVADQQLFFGDAQ